jgi:hypothetical protein
LYPGLEQNWSQFMPNLAGYTEVSEWWQYPWGANWSARRSVLVQMGGFRAEFGRRGQNYGGGEEILAALLAQRLGYAVAIVPETEVLHDVEPQRYTWQHIKQTHIAGALVKYRMQKAGYLPMEASLRDTLTTILHTPVDIGIAGPRSVRQRERRYRRSAHIYLLIQQLRDRHGRRRKPIAVR